MAVALDGMRPKRGYPQGRRGPVRLIGSHAADEEDETVWPAPFAVAGWRGCRYQIPRCGEDDPARSAWVSRTWARLTSSPARQTSSPS